MAVNVAKIRQLIAAGFDRLEFHVLDTNGYIAGVTGSVTAGVAAGAPAGRIKGVQTSNIQIGQPETVPVPGDDSTLGQFSFDADQPPEFDIDVGVMNFLNDAYFQGVTEYQDGDILFGGLQPIGTTRPDVMLIGVSRAKSQGSGFTGLSVYEGVIVPKCTMIPLGRVERAGRQGGVFRYRVICQLADSIGTGYTFHTGSGNIGFEQAPIINWSAENRITAHRWTGDGATTLWTSMAYTPAEATITTKNRIRVGPNIQNSGATISTTNKTLTITPAVASGTQITNVYEYTLS